MDNNMNHKKKKMTIGIIALLVIIVAIISLVFSNTHQMFEGSPDTVPNSQNPENP